MKYIEVSKPTMPNFKSWQNVCKKIWQSGILTHNGPYVQQFEKKLKKNFKLRNSVLVANCTLGIHAALKSLKIDKGEIIVTPFTWIATISPLLWEGIKPIFVDIDEQTWNIDVNQVERYINKKTKAIIAVHAFSNPCDITKLEKICNINKIKLIFDAAHSLGVKYKNKSIMNYGDFSIASLHATKILNAAEGGLCVSKKKNSCEDIKKIRFFGFDRNKRIKLMGNNLKMSELHAGLGLLNLSNFKKTLKLKKNIFYIYYKELSQNKHIQFQKFNPEEYNFSYVAIKFTDNKILKKVIKELYDNKINTRRYFYPSLNKLFFFKKDKIDNMKNSINLADTILTLPSHERLNKKMILNICKLINSVTNSDKV